MGKCNNCVKFLTCNRTECNQVTYLQANQIDKIEARKRNEKPLEADIRKLTEAMIKVGVISKQVLESLNTKKQKGKING